MRISQQITFLDTRDLRRTADFADVPPHPQGVVLTLVTDEDWEIQRFWEPLV